MIRIAKSVYSTGWYFQLPANGELIKLVRNNTTEFVSYTMTNGKIELTDSSYGDIIDVHFTQNEGYYKYGEVMLAGAGEIRNEVIVLDEAKSPSDARMSLIISNGSSMMGLEGASILVRATNYPYGFVGKYMDGRTEFDFIWSTVFVRGADTSTGVVPPSVSSVFDLIDGPVTAISIDITAPDPWPVGVGGIPVQWCLKR